MTVKTYAPEDVRIVIGHVEIPASDGGVLVEYTGDLLDLGVHYASRWPAVLLPMLRVGTPEPGTPEVEALESIQEALDENVDDLLRRNERLMQDIEQWLADNPEEPER